MNTIRTIIAAAAVSGLMLGAASASATDATNDANVTQQIGSSSGGYSTDATDRGGRPAPEDNAAQTGIAILDWLRGLMD